MATRVAPVVVIGMGNPMRRDDGVGHAALQRLEDTDLATTPGEVELLTLDGEPTRLIDAWRERRRAIVIDAGRAGDDAGTVHRVTVGRDPLPGWTAMASSHSAGLGEAIALARALDSLPSELVVFGVEPDDLSFGEGLSTDVAAALPGLVDRIVAEART